MAQEKSKKDIPELDKAFDDLSNKINFIGITSGAFVLNITELKNIDSMGADELRTNLKKAINSFSAIESRNQEAGKIMRETIFPSLRKNKLVSG